MSASASEYTSKEAFDAGCDAFLAKPLDLAELLDCVGRLLGLTWRYAAVPAPPTSAMKGNGDFTIDPVASRELNHLAMLGDIAALMRRADEAFQSDPSAQSFYRELRSLADQYDTAAIRRLLSAHTLNDQ
jgi:DNA-binding response OmpR family regulator